MAARAIPTPAGAMMAAALLGIPWQSGARLPFEELGVTLLAEADARGAVAREPVSKDDAAATLDRLEVLHHCIDLGAMELWIPEVALDASGSLRKGLGAREAEHWAFELIELQRRWLDLFEPADDRRAELSAAIDRIEAWVEHGSREKDDTPELRADRALLLSTFRNEEVPRAPILMIAPTRPHFIGLFGAAGIVNKYDRNRLWSEGLRSNAFAWLAYEVIVIPLEAGPDVGATTLVAPRLEADLVLETIVHRGSHMLSGRAVPLAPEWFREGLAIHDTIGLVGDDDSLCTGFSQRERLLIGVAYHQWVDANHSPYREGAAVRWYVEELRPDEEGRFQIHDLDRSKPGIRVPGPFLGPVSEIPEEVMASGEGVRRGYAEFYRAYCATFVHWLSEQRVGDHSVLTWLIQFVSDPARQRVVPPGQLVPMGLRMITLKTLGESGDPGRDIEAAFDQWLAER